MKLAYTWEEIERWRDRVYRRTPRRAVRTKHDALAFVESTGFCFAFRSEDAELPSLSDAASGARHVTLPRNGHADGLLLFVREMEAMLPAERKLYLGKILQRRPTMISLEFLPCFYALSGRIGDTEEYAVEYKRGKLSSSARAIMEVLSDSSPQETKWLKRTANLHKPHQRRAFDSAVAELQAKMFLVKVGDPRDPMAAGWAPFHQVFRKQVRIAQRISMETARARILEQYFKNQLVANVSAIGRLFGWNNQTVFQALGHLTHSGVILPNVRVSGRDHRYYCLVQ